MSDSYNLIAKYIKRGLNMKSFIVTGASASGKTTLINEAILNGYRYLPTHMTRKKRNTEVAGRDAIFISEEDFLNNFANGYYLEPSLEYAQTINSYYGTPMYWINVLMRDNYCASPVSALLAQKIKKCIPNLLWIYLKCDQQIRLSRLESRGLSTIEVEKRMQTINNQVNLSDDVVVFDTGLKTPLQILNEIMEL